MVCRASSSNATLICSYITSSRLRRINPRTVELFRQVGLEPTVRAASYVSSDRYGFVLIRAETLADEEYAGIDEDEGNSSDPAASPSAFGAIDQDKLKRSYSGTGRGNWCRDVRFLLQS
jgi:hypothetical protein